MTQHISVIDIEKELASKLEEKLVQTSPISAQSCIFRVPDVFRSHNEPLFNPNVVSIGPYNRHLENLECFIKSIKANVKHCLECYAEQVTMKMEEFVEMTVIDGCFVLEFFRRWAYMVPASADDPLFKISWMRKFLVLDLLLLENHLPWFLLVLGYLRSEQITVDSKLQNKHLLDLQRNIITSGSEEPMQGFPSTPCMGQGKDLMNIQFKNGVLIIPPIVIVDNVESLFRNLIAYQQSDSSLKDKFTAYILNISEKRIITCFLDPDDVSRFFRRLYNDAHVTYSAYVRLSQEINDYCASPWPRWRATLSRDYFSNPWSIISLIAGIIILVLTFLQSVYSML
ncbi:hypothetical protein P3X46_023487 [Hevea brasiliensis]|uniref:Uncharacterized protein n=1 Tax=Hevea brasiliensis TaxID=3981 RepID=A0ABQ9LDT8_HEVBR|nr:hypothetical protein P3X46_023487 [Hevea brasiliensis]